MTTLEDIYRLAAERELLERAEALREAICGPLGRVVPEIPEHVRRELEGRN